MAHLDKYKRPYRPAIHRHLIPHIRLAMGFTNYRTLSDFIEACVIAGIKEILSDPAVQAEVRKNETAMALNMLNVVDPKPYNPRQRRSSFPNDLIDVIAVPDCSDHDQK